MSFDSETIQPGFDETSQPAWEASNITSRD
jgi:hypothetical protein